MKIFVDPVRDLGGLLLDVEKPGRYAGGEYGRRARRDAALQCLIAFPDLYEIGMSNQALRIIYNGLNRIPGVSCDRACAPAPDFEKLLRGTGTPLYGLDTGISLASLDLLLFTLGYELGAGGVLAMLDVSGIPLRCTERGGNHPIVIAGGPAVSNPLPYSPFIDAFWIGEAEGGMGGNFFDLAAELALMKQSGQGRAALLARIAAHPHIWVKGKEKTVRAVDADFSGRAGEAAVFPVASMKTVQHHGAVEIMRGCPNGCRFCHAGFWYRPMRQKKAERVIEEAAAFIGQGGYREISLSSLSSGDYAGIGGLVDALNERFGERRVSFQMPSLRVSGFALSLLEKISTTRKSGLTFAVETPADAWQMAINKQVARDSVVEILREAKKHGWRGAKFYFMIGLPESSDSPESDDSGESGASDSEESGIVDFIVDVARGTGMHFNINVGIFVPKPHTPYQWAAQIDGDTAAAKLDYIRSKLKPLGHKVSVSDPLISRLEGLLSRGDERAGDIIEAAYRGGSRLDAWQEYINRDAWLNIIEQNRNLVDEFLREKPHEAPLPWQGIHSGVSTAFLRRERDHSANAALTPPCAEECASPCGICGSQAGITRNSAEYADARQDSPPVNLSENLVNTDDVNRIIEVVNTDFVNRAFDEVNSRPEQVKKADPSIARLVFSFSKEGSAVFHGHLSLIEIFSMAFTRAGLPVLYTQGFNPLAKIEFASPLSTGVSAAAEIAAADFAAGSCPDGFTEKLNAALPDGIRVTRAAAYAIPGGAKKHSLSSLLWGFAYAGGQDGQTVYVQSGEEKQFRQRQKESGIPLFSLRRGAVLAKNTAPGNEQPWASYFDVYAALCETFCTLL